MRNWQAAMAGALGLTLVACGGSAPAGGEDASAKASEAPGEIAGAASAGGAAVAEAAADAGAPSAAASAAAPAAGSAPDLTTYVGKTQQEPVDGVAWEDHPLVVAGIRQTVTDAGVRRAMQSPGGPTAPVATYQGKVGGWGCEQHNCGDHQWAVLVDPRSGATDVCYHNAAQTGTQSRWFLAAGREETRPGNCSVV
jgi:hypothetical protein